ncbi:MAG TPA: asparagine synthase C-terminal domain-containing protein [Nitrosopumilaceae archaeon]|nr:asparagine synthase C-terminal domain-containing protein [Nitrosopumilaceae archaeon]
MANLVSELYNQITKSIQNTVKDKKIGIAFSGGVDSTLLAKMCVDLGYDVTLLTIGFEDSHDIMFSQEISKILGYDHKIEKIKLTNFSKVSKEIQKIIKTDNLSWIENCIAFYYVSNLAKRYDIKKVITANGVDELFCGYNAYRNAIKSGEPHVMKLMESKLENEIKMMKAINLITSQFGVVLIQPFLSQDFIDFAKKISLKHKIYDSDDLLRKHIIRELALKIGVPEISSNKRKKALQYGSLIHKTLMKIK